MTEVITTGGWSSYRTIQFNTPDFFNSGVWGCMYIKKEISKPETKNNLSFLVT